MSRKIGIVTVLYNSESVLEEFFETLSTQTYNNFILYVVDNLSPDGSLALSEKLASHYQFETRIIKNDTNYGVAKGNNIGIRRALADDCDLVLLSNNDIALEDNSIDKLLVGLDKNNADMAVPKIYLYGTKQIWAAGGGFVKRNGLTAQYGQEQEDEGQFNSDQKVDYAPTCFMLIKKEVFDSVGLMDENYFVYYDDTDFVYRALKYNEKSLWYIANSVIHHNESTSTGKMSDFSVRFLWRNLVYFALKNYKPFYAGYVLIYNFLYILIILYFRYSPKQWKIALGAYREGFGLYINNRPV
ncbi:glycosyltransferase family 2 protein [Chryseobacterium turcicum]|uniref:Glycosyltransferase family 2 protein n=1 Tax=Chryseobacterium turcicum TaxID=2898076 RepID=A0A9Q3V198_9FLAO|nr:glycosyltransferase family 2 protein [Chryseobacterium turcicum]MCD1116497.1 glycosyltransferase family 2 protein [Chryseobacterium turcicum]